MTVAIDSIDATIDEGREPDDTGSQTIEVLMWASMGVVIVVLLGGLVQALGVDVVDQIRAALGL